MRIYHYDSSTKAFLTAGEAFPSPLEPGVFLIPAQATDIPPPEAGANEVALFDGELWQLKPDWRTVALYATADGAPVTITEIGQTPADVAATDRPRPSPAFVWQDNEWVEDATALEAWLASTKTAKRAEINESCNQAISALATAYPEREIQSWPQQVKEAEALVADPQAKAPLLEAIATARQLPTLALAERVLAKMAAYAVASGALIGKRQALEDLIDLAASLDDVAQVAW